MSERPAKYVSIRTLRPALPSVIRDVAVASARYVVTRRGKPEAVLLGLAEYERLLAAAHKAELRRFRRLLKRGIPVKYMRTVDKAIRARSGLL